MDSVMCNRKLVLPKRFIPPLVRSNTHGISAFHKYDWYFNWMKLYLAGKKSVFLTPCAATKPIYSSSFHRGIYQKFSAVYGKNKKILVVSEPVVLIRYQDLYTMEKYFMYDFPPKLLDITSREFFVKRLRILLSDKKISGCLPRHHASLINDAIGKNWKNFWDGDMYSMMKKASALNR